MITKLAIDESSLGRVYQHVMGHSNVKSWGMITAFRAANSSKENQEANKQLQSDLKSKGLGFFKIEGHWRECQDTLVSYNECPPNRLRDAKEETLFIPNITSEQIRSLCKKYNQDAVVYGDDKTPGEANLIFKNGSTESIGKFHPQKVSQAFSGVHAKTFMFKKGNNADKKKNTKLKSLIPKDILNKTIKNPKTGHTIKVKSALSYGKSSPVYNAAKSMIQRAIA